MTDLPETLKAFSDAAADMLAGEIRSIRKEAERLEEMRTLEHRAFMAEQREAVADLKRQVEERLAAVKDGSDGRDGIDGKDGRDGIDGLNGKDGSDGLNGADADMEALTKHLDQLVAAIRVPENGRDGRDGVDGKDAYAGEVKGVFDPETEYRARDVVAFDGASWMAKADQPGELPGDGWMMLACRGKRGEKGDRGEQGNIGLTGKDGASIIAAYTKDTDLILTRDDGIEVKADLYDFGRVIRGE